MNKSVHLENTYLLLAIKSLLYQDFNLVSLFSQKILWHNIEWKETWVLFEWNTGKPWYANVKGNDETTNIFNLQKNGKRIKESLKHICQ